MKLTADYQKKKESIDIEIIIDTTGELKKPRVNRGTTIVEQKYSFLKIFISSKLYLHVPK